MSTTELRSIEVAGLSHGGMPIPVAAKRGGLLISGGISGTDPGSGDIPQDLDAEAAQVFANIGSVLSAAGMSAADLVKITFFVVDRAVRSSINGPWVELFPDPRDRPARHTLLQALPSGMRMQAEIVAFAI
jgi:2-iminobutanoate/2-iminopropanoate deaminase